MSAFRIVMVVCLLLLLASFATGLQEEAEYKVASKVLGLTATALGSAAALAEWASIRKKEEEESRKAMEFIIGKQSNP